MIYKLVEILEAAQFERAVATNAESIKELDASIADLQAAINSILSRQSKREEEKKREEKHAASLKVCRTAKDEAERLNRELASAEETFLAAESAVRFAESHLATIQNSKPRDSDYPTHSELAKWRQTVQGAEKKLEDKMEARRMATVTRDRLARELMEARLELGRAEFAERQLRPQQPEETFSGLRYSKGVLA